MAAREDQMAALADTIRAALPPDAREAFLDYEMLQEARSTAQLAEVRRRLRTLFPKRFWPLLGIAFSVDSLTWLAFESEQVDGDVMYRADLPH